MGKYYLTGTGIFSNALLKYLPYENEAYVDCVPSVTLVQAEALPSSDDASTEQFIAEALGCKYGALWSYCGIFETPINWTALSELYPADELEKLRMLLRAGFRFIFSHTDGMVIDAPLDDE